MLKQRIAILKEAQVISIPCADYVNGVIDLLEPLHLDQAKLEMFTTHLAMATERMMKNDSVECLDEAIWQEVSGCATYQKAEDFYLDMVQGCPIDYPKEEKQFLMMHLCNLFQD